MFELFGLIPILILVGIVVGIVWLTNRKKEDYDVLFWKKFALGSVIALVFPFMVYYGIQTFVEQPKYNEYVTAERYIEEEDARRTLNEEYQNQVKVYKDALTHNATIEFFVWVTVGALAVAGGVFLSIPAAGIGITWGGLFSMMAGYSNYFSYMSEAMVFASAVLALISFIYVAYKKFGKDLVKK